MSSKAGYLISFAIGAAVGAAAAWMSAKKKYQQLVEEEIHSVKESYSRREAVVVNAAADDEDAESKRKESVVEYAAKLHQLGYTADAAKPENADVPHVISPEEFGEMDDYEKISLTYYADNVVADDLDAVLDDVEHIIGAESLKHFGEYEDDSVFVRNDRLKCDYEILLDHRTYQEVLEEKPYLLRKG